MAPLNSNLFIDKVCKNDSILYQLLELLSKRESYALAATTSKLYVGFYRKIKRLSQWKTLYIDPKVRLAMEHRTSLLSALLKSVEIVSARVMLSTTILTHLALESSALKSLNLQSINNDTAKKCFTNSLFPALTHIKLGGIGLSPPIGTLNDSAIRDILSGIGQQLVSLQLNNLTELTSHSFGCVSTFCSTRLEQLCIISCTAMLKSVKAIHCIQLLKKVGANLEIIDFRFSLEITNEILSSLSTARLKRLRVFLASRSLLCDLALHASPTFARRNYSELNQTIWLNLVTTYKTAQLIHIDDLTSEIYSVRKPKYIHQTVNVDEIEYALVHYMPIAAQLVFTSPTSDTSNKSGQASDDDHLCSAGSNGLSLCNPNDLCNCIPKTPKSPPMPSIQEEPDPHSVLSFHTSNSHDGCLPCYLQNIAVQKEGTWIRLDE